MKKYAYYVMLCIVPFVLAACVPQREYGPELTEPARIVEVVYTPRQHGSGNGIGFSSSGSTTFTYTDITVQETYAVVFQCQHGKFIVKDKAVWEKAVDGMDVTVHYREIFEVTKDKRTLVDYDFRYFTNRE